MFLQCFDAVGWMTENIHPVKACATYVQRFPFLEHLDEENIGEVANTSSSGKWLLWRWVDHGAITSQESL